MRPRHQSLPRRILLRSLYDGWRPCIQGDSVEKRVLPRDERHRIHVLEPGALRHRHPLGGPSSARRCRERDLTWQRSKRSSSLVHPWRLGFRKKFVKESTCPGDKSPRTSSSGTTSKNTTEPSESPMKKTAKAGAKIKSRRS